MTAAQAWREMLAADQAALEAKKLGAVDDPFLEKVMAARNARRAFSEALGVWERAA